MPAKYRPITQKEKTIQIGIGLFLAILLAIFVSLIAPFLFQWTAGFFDPAPNAPRECKISDFLEKTLTEYRACKDQSNSFPIRIERLSRKIPWFWIAFMFFAWAFNRNPLKGRILDDSDVLRYEGQGAWEFISMLLGIILFYFLFWALLARDIISLVASGILVCLMILGYILHRWLLKKYGMTGRERQETAQTSPLIEALVRKPKL